MSASKELLERLHEQLTEKLLEKIEAGTATPAEIGHAIRFLKDNGIEAVAVPGSNLNNLAKAFTRELPFSDPSDPSFN